MKLVFISDIHGSEYWLNKALGCFEKEQGRKLVILGDILYHGPRNPLPKGYNPWGVAESLNQIKEQIVAIRGNCDSEVDQMVLSFPMMSENGIILTDTVQIFLTHGHVYSPHALPPLPKEAVFAWGHTHIPELGRSGDFFFFNPGSVSLPKGGSRPCYGVFDGETICVKEIEGNEVFSIRVEKISS